MTAPQPTTADVLIDFISAFFVPMFLATSNGDIALARLAAIQTMNAYRIQHQADLLAVAQIVAFGFATLSSLSLSMDDDISLSMILRLRGNANACNRSAEQNRQALQTHHQAAEAASTPQAHPPTDAAQAPTPPMTEDQQRRARWAAAFTEVAADYAAELLNLPPAEQHAVSIRPAVLSSGASASLSDVPVSQGASAPGIQPNKLKRPQPA